MKPIDDPDAQTDAVVLAATAALDHPSYVIEELIEKGLMPRVYSELARRLEGRTLDDLPVSELSAVVLDVIAEQNAATQEEPPAADEQAGTQRMYPYYETDERFPAPRPVSGDVGEPDPHRDDEPSTQRPKPTPPEDALEAVRDVVSRWKRGMAVANGAMSEIDAILAHGTVGDV